MGYGFQISEPLFSHLSNGASEELFKIGMNRKCLVQCLVADTVVKGEILWQRFYLLAQETATCVSTSLIS